MENGLFGFEIIFQKKTFPCVDNVASSWLRWLCCESLEDRTGKVAPKNKPGLVEPCKLTNPPSFYFPVTCFI